MICLIGVIDESALTGEAKPLPKKKHDKVSSGTIVQNGYLEILVETDPAQSTMMKLKEAVLDVQADKGEFGRLIDKISCYWTPGVLIAALCVSVIGGAATGDWTGYTMKGKLITLKGKWNSTNK